MNKSAWNKTKSSPVEIHNSIQSIGKEDLKLENQFRTYRSMLEDSVISGSVSFIKSVLNRRFTIKPHPSATAKEKALVEALNKSLDSLSPYPFNRTMNNILSLVEYGTSLQEVTFHRVGGYQVFKSFSPISLQSVQRYQYDKGKLEKLILNPPENDGKLVQDTSASPVEIDGEKILQFSFQADSDNPLGKSLLRGAYSTWKEKTTYRELGLVGASKNLSGVMQVKVPSEYLQAYFSDPSSDHAQMVHQLIQQAEMLGQGLSSFVALPSDQWGEGMNASMFSVEPIRSEGTPYDIEASISRCNRELHMALQASVLSLGQDDSGSGSYGLSSTKSVLLHQFLQSVHSTIASEFMKAIRVAFRLNGLTEDRLPSIEWEDMQRPSWEEFTEGFKALGGSGLITKTPELETWARESIGAPVGDVPQEIATGGEEEQEEAQ